MTFVGDVEFKEGRAPSRTTTMVLERCLTCEKQAAAKGIGDFLKAMSIKPEAFFHDIDGDWGGRPFIGQHVFKVVQAAGYGGTEHDLWYSVMGHDAPYPVKKLKAPLKDAVQKARHKRKGPKVQQEA